MNERIRLLAQQADEGYTGDSKDDMGASLVGNDAIEKFAELIVAECVSVVDGMADPEDSDRYFWAIQNTSQKIKQHFGVEE